MNRTAKFVALAFVAASFVYAVTSQEWFKDALAVLVAVAAAYLLAKRFAR